MHFAEQHNSRQRSADRSIDEHAPLVRWDDATTSSSISSTSSRMGKPMSRGSSSSKSPPQKQNKHPAGQRFRARPSKKQAARRQHKKQQVVDSALAKVEAAPEAKSDAFIHETLDWMENGSRQRTVSSDMSESADDGSNHHERQATNESLAKMVTKLAKDVLKRLSPNTQRTLQRVYHKGLTYRAGMAAWSMRTRHDWTTFYETTTPEQRRDRAVQWCKRRKKQLGVAIAVLLVMYVLRSSGPPHDMPDPAKMDSLNEGLDAGAGAATLDGIQRSQSAMAPGGLAMEDSHQHGGEGAATYFDNVSGLLRGSRQTPREEQLTSGSSDKQTITVKKKKKYLSEDVPDIPLTAPWRPRKRDESKRPPPGLPEKFWHPRHRPITTKHYATLKNAPGDASKTTPIAPKETKTIKEYNPVVGNQVLEHWERNHEKKQQHAGN